MISRVGFGYDAHRLEKGRKLIIGGIEIESEHGAIAHSDGDVLLHAIIDALLGAAALGDIGTHFPDSDNSFKNIDSKVLLKKSYELVMKEGYKIANIDTTICLQAPKLISYVPEMQKTIAKVLNISGNMVSVKCTTTERMGFVGTGEGIAAYAVVGLNA